MSSRWISTSLRWPRATLRLTAAWEALTRDDLPMPRAPQSSALFAGRPLAKRSVFSIRVSRTRSMPLSSVIWTRLTRGTGTSREPCACQMKASAESKSELECCRGASRSNASAIRVNVCASGAPDFGLADLGFSLDFGLDLDFAIGTLSVRRSHTRCGLRPASCKTRRNQDFGALSPHGAALQLVHRPLYSAHLRAPLGRQAPPGQPPHYIADIEAFHVHFACIRTGVDVRRWQRQHAGL